VTAGDEQDQARENLLAACESADRAIVDIQGILERVGDVYQAATDAAASYLELWVVLGRACETLGAPNPVLELTDIWSWVALCQGDLALGSERGLWLVSRVQVVMTFTAATRARIERGERFPFSACYYADRRGLMPVRDYVNVQGSGPTQLIKKRIKLLNQLTRERPFLAYPHGDALDGPNGDGFFELRVPLANQHRILYRPHGQIFVLLHAFQKDERKVPESDKKIASGRWDDFVARLGTIPDPLGDPAP
jgi:putative component of toxin-antitoxin plasmid stabilization module